MAKQTINYGSAPNDGTGDTARVAFTKTKQNFDELYTASVNLSDFGAIGDGSTDNAVALMAFNAWARLESLAGRGVVLHVNPGIYNFNHANCIGYLYGIKRLHVKGYGATFQNTYDRLVGGSSIAQRAWGTGVVGALVNGGGRKLIATAVVAANTVTLLTVGEHTSFPVGKPCMVASLDMQKYGFPPNPDQFDFVTITVNPGTGVLTFTPKLRYNHRSDFPDYNAAGWNIGAAGIWPLGDDDEPWDIDHIYEGIYVGAPPNDNIYYITTSGQRIRWINHSVPGISESLAGSVEQYGGTLRDFSEPDKIVGLVLHDSMVVHSEQHNPFFNFQSSSVDRFVSRSSKYSCQVNVGAVKSAYFENPDIKDLIFGGGIGLNRSTIVMGGAVHSMSTASGIGFTYGSVTDTVDGTNVTFADGVFSILTVDANIWAGVIPGSKLFFTAAGNFFPGDIGVGIVTEITEDATHFIIKTTLPYATVPAWATGVKFQRTGKIEVHGTTGCEFIRKAAEATQRGKIPGEFIREVFFGNGAASGTWANYIAGDLTRVYFNVVQAAPANGRLTISTAALTKSAMDDQKTYVFVLDTTVVGKREYTQIALVGKTANDTIKLGGVDQNPLPVGRWVKAGDNATMSWAMTGYTRANFDPFELPIIEMELEFDTGILRKFIPGAADFAGNVMSTVLGTLP